MKTILRLICITVFLASVTAFAADVYGPVSVTFINNSGLSQTYYRSVRAAGYADSDYQQTIANGSTGPVSANAGLKASGTMVTVWIWRTGVSAINIGTFAYTGAAIDCGTYLDNGSTLANNSVSYTNYVMNLVNNLGVQAKATWTYNGSVVKQVILQPGQTDSWTTPSLQVSPTRDPFTLTSDLRAIQQTITYNNDGGPTFTNLSYGGGFSGTSSNVTTTGGATSSGTSGTVASGTGAITPSTNNIVWGTPTGTATESTLQKGFSVLHSDNQDLLNGVSILSGQLAFATNALGVISVYTRSNNDVAWQQISAITNLAKALTNQPASVSMTNYATETTQRSISNFLANLSSNFWGDAASTNEWDILSVSNGIADTDISELTNWNYAYTGTTNSNDAINSSATAANVTESETALDTWKNSITDFSASMNDYYPAVPMKYTFNWGSGSKEFDFDPLAYDWAANLFALCRSMIAWLIVLYYMKQITEDAMKVIMILEEARGANSAAVKAEIKKLS